MKRIFLLMLGISSIGLLKAQVGVNTTDPKVSLDVRAASTDPTTAEGFTAPRLTLNQLASKDAKYTTDQTGTVVYVTDVTGTNTGKTRKITSIGYYYFDGTIWQNMCPDENLRFFYMPSTVLPTDTSSPSYNPTTETFSVDLYKAYAEQFGFAAASSASSTKSPMASSLFVFGDTSLEYFITYYDNTVFKNVAINNAGVLTYQLPEIITVTDKTFMNVVFKIK